MQVTLQDRERLNQIGPGLEDIMDTLVASVQGGWDIEHLHNGAHNNVHAQSIYSLGGFTERERATAMGVPIAYTPTLFGALTNNPTAVSCCWAITGTTLTLNLQIQNFSAAAAVQGLVSLPPGFGGTIFGATGFCLIVDNGVQSVGYWFVGPGSTSIAVQLLSGTTNWTVSANNSSLYINGSVPVTPLAV